MNRLEESKSPYLLQHADNPVDWYPWCNEAFSKAADEDKPIFLSVGYSTCHWCHVMAKESFNDPEVAEILNKNYISIKVDREERPDVDSVYQEACLAATGQGGWPLTVIMDADKRPFFAGTYFPKTRKYGKPGLPEILGKVNEMWENDRQKLIDSAEMLVGLLQEDIEKHEGSDPGDRWLNHAYNVFKVDYDPYYGGFGDEPKFPMPVNLSFLLRYYNYTGNNQALDMVERTLVMMRKGGLYDQIGFGFHRYSTDGKWLVPHFEKMLYDNALLATAYLEAYQITQKLFYAQVAREIFIYLLRDMKAPDGGFASAEDADSEGVEGKYYTWSQADIYKILGNDDGRLFSKHFNITERGNFEGGRSIPNLIGQEVYDSVIDIDKHKTGGNRIRVSTADNDRPYILEGALEKARTLLLEARINRPKPFRDDKVLTSWNGLLITAFAKGGRVLNEQEYTKTARDTAKFILENLRGTDGRLLARYRSGEAIIPAYLDDYAFFIQGLIELWESQFEYNHIQAAIELMDQQIELFWDKENKGFFFTSHDSHDLPVRRKDVRDGALPSGNSVSAHNLIKLSRLTGRREWGSMANQLLHAFSGRISRYPSGYPTFLSAWLLSKIPPIEIVVSGYRNQPETRRLKEEINKLFLPQATISYNSGDAEDYELDRILSPTLNKKPVQGKALVYVCKGLTCLEPIDKPDALREVLGFSRHLITAPESK